MTRAEKRFLSRRICAWCDQPLDKDWCSAIWEKCSPEIRAKRREDCLRTRKPTKRGVVLLLKKEKK
jgi:hypothetical protein